MNQAIFVLFVIGVYVALPAVMIWGWARWAKRREPRTTFSTLSLIGFTLGTVSGLLSLAAMVCAIIGLWRPNPLRWHAPVCAVGTLAFWLAAAAGE